MKNAGESMSLINQRKMINRLKKVGYVLISPLVFIPTIVVMAIMMLPLAFLAVTEYVVKGNADEAEMILGYIIYPIWWILEKIWGK